MEMRLISIAKLHSHKWTAHLADENDYPLCGVRKKQGVPVIPGTVKLNCSRCMDALARIKLDTLSKKVEESSGLSIGSSPTIAATNPF